MFGDASFSRAPGIYKIRGVEDCRCALDEIQDGRTPWGSVEDYLKTVDAVTRRYDLYFKDMISIRRTGSTVMSGEVACDNEIDCLAKEFIEMFNFVRKQNVKVS
ncbi:hypothetical protein DSM101010T_35190 [Desulfovibrio subterraneus]|uniref:Uncharacterized protein n=1 Tax=Desulfovibrio subterraneus TaxID=2718620 RepID=A0A7J0BQ10_9BACT|nr:hypothetical protein DSM101010T_35190 [Desulfovibrio subterraneus]